MGLNAAFSSWLRGAQSFATTTLRTAQNYGAALQQQTMTAVSAVQRAATQPFQQVLQPRPSSRSPAPNTVRTITPVDVLAGAGRVVSGGARAVQQAAAPIVRAHAPIVQGIQRDAGRVIQMAPAAARSAPAAIQSGTRQILQAHSPIMQGVQRDAGSAIRSIPGAGALRQPAPRAVSSPTPTGTSQAQVQLPGAPTSPASPTDGALAALRDYPFNAPAFQAARWVGGAAASAVKGGLVLPSETEARYREHQAANEAYQNLRKQYSGNFDGDTFVARSAQDMAAYGRLQSAANKVEKTGQAYETASQQEMFGLPAAARGVGDWFSAQDQKISGAALRYAPWLKSAPDVAGRARDIAGVVTPSGLVMTSADAVAGKVARSLLNKSEEDLPTPREYSRAATQGVAEGWVYQPMTSAAWFGVGGALGGGIGAAGRAAKPVTKALAPLAKTTGISRLLAPAKPYVARGVDLAWKGVGVAYGADVGYRSTIDENGYIRPPLHQARELGRISATEALPMGAGAAAISRAPALVRRAAAAPQRMVSSFRGRSAPPAGMKGGWYPENWQIMDGLRMQALSPSSTIKTVRGSSRYPSSRVEMVEVGPGRRIPKGEMDNFLRRFEVETPAWRRPIPEEYLAQEDIAQAYKFGGRGGVSLPGDPTPRAGWYPENWQILEGLRMREAAAPFRVARGGGSRYPSSRVEMVEVSPGKRIPKGEMDNFLRRFEVETPAWRRPIPEEYLAREDIAEAYKFGGRGVSLLDRVPPEYRAKWGGGAPEAFYAGAPMGRSRQVHRQRFPTRKSPSSSSGRTPRIRPTTRTVPVEPSSGQASPLMLWGWQDGALGEVAVTALSPAQVVSPVTDSLSVIGPRNASILDLGLGSSVLSRSGLDLLGRQGVLSVQTQEQGQRQGVLLISDQLQSMMQTSRLRQRQKQKQKQRSRYARPRLPTAPKAKARPRARARKSDEDEAERRRRLREAQEAAHWELGPAPGVEEMAGMIFGSGRSVLNLGGGLAPAFGFTTRSPARPPVIPSFGPTRPPAKTTGKIHAHAGKSPAKQKNGAKKKK